MSISMSLAGLPEKKLRTGHNKLERAGITPARWLAMLNANEMQMRRIVDYWPQEADVPATNAPEGHAGIVYDAESCGRILGLPCKSRRAAPVACKGEIVIYYGGWNISALRDCEAGKKRLNKGTFDDDSLQAKAGYYRVIPRFPRSNFKSWDEQVDYLKAIDEKSEPAPTIVVVTALLIHLAETGESLLGGGECRCAELERRHNPRPDFHRMLFVSKDDGRVYVNLCVNYKAEHDLWLSSVRRS